MSAAKVLLLALVVLTAGALLWHVPVNAGSAADIKYKFTALNPPGAVFTIARGINARGEVVGTYVGSANSQHGFVEIGGKFTTLDFPGAAFPNGSTAIFGINDRDEVVGTYSGGDCISERGTCGFAATPVQP